MDRLNTFGWVGPDEIRRVADRADHWGEKLREQTRVKGQEQALGLRFRISEAGKMVDRTPQWIRQAEAAGKLPAPLTDQKGRRRYTLEAINHMRAVAGTRPCRNPKTDPALILAFHNWKGGVGKSTLTAHLAQSLALMGYRVCVVDCDPQGHTTSLFGIDPTFDLREEETLLPFFFGDQPRLNYALRRTRWDQLAMIPASGSLYQAERCLAAYPFPEVLDRLSCGIDDIANGCSEADRARNQYPHTCFEAGFDVILIDAPSDLNLISLSVMRAANALIVPCRPSLPDLGSTVRLLDVVVEMLEKLKSRRFPGGYKFIRLLANCVNVDDPTETSIVSAMRRAYGHFMFQHTILNSPEVEIANRRSKTIYELDQPASSRNHQSVRASLDAVSREIELLIRRTWPSHHDWLRQKGLV